MKIQISKNFTKDNCIVLLLCAMLLGSFAYVVNRSFAMGTLFSFFLGPIYFFRLINRNRISKTNALMLLTLALLVILSLVAFSIFPVYENAQYIKAFIFAFFSFSIIAVISKNDPRLIDWAVSLYAIIILIFGLMQVSYIYSGVGIDPSRVDAESYVVENLIQFSSPRSIFTNPNDFAAICLLLLIYVLFSISLSNFIKNSLIITLVLMIIFAASRLSLVGMILVFAIRYLRDWKNFWKIIIYIFLTGAILLIAVFGFGFDFSNSQWVRKATSIINFALYYIGYGSGKISDGSVDIRLETYLDFISNLNSIAFGSFKAQDYSYFISDVLMRQNPHSLLVELGLLYGYFGVAIYISIVLWVYFSARGIHNKLSAYGLSIAVIILTFVSSSEINFPAFWVLLFMCFMVRPSLLPKEAVSHLNRIGAKKQYIR